MNSKNEFLHCDGTFKCKSALDKGAHAHEDEKSAKDKVRALGQSKLSIIRVSKKDNLKK